MTRHLVAAGAALALALFALAGDASAQAPWPGQQAYGYQWVFILAGAIALVGFFVCLRIRTPVTDVPTFQGSNV